MFLYHYIELLKEIITTPHKPESLSSGIDLYLPTPNATTIGSYLKLFRVAFAVLIQSFQLLAKT